MIVVVESFRPLEIVKMMKMMRCQRENENKCFTQERGENPCEE